MHLEGSSEVIDHVTQDEVEAPWPFKSFTEPDESHAFQQKKRKQENWKFYKTRHRAVRWVIPTRWPVTVKYTSCEKQVMCWTTWARSYKEL